MLRPSKKTAILLVAGVVVCGLAAGLVLSGHSVTGSLGVMGRTVIEKSVGLFAYSNRSTDAGKSPQKTQTTPAMGTSAMTAPEVHLAGAAATAGEATGAPMADATIAALAGASAGAADPSAETAGLADQAAAPANESKGNPTAAPATESTAEQVAAPTAEATPGAIPPEYVDAKVRVTPLDENDVTIGSGADDSAESDGADADEFAFDDERSLRTEGPSYSTLGKKDPFYAMVTAKEQKAAASDLLDPDRLRLVGVIWGKNGIGALVEDGRGRGYCLHEGDRVLFGRVVSVTRDKCVIHQVVYGEFKTVELHLMAQREEE